MYNMSYESVFQECSREYQNTSYAPQEQSSTSRFIYIKQHIDENSSHVSSNRSQKVLVNPHFKTSKVFVNPNFSGVQPNTIHVNPRLRNLNVSVLGDKQSIAAEPHQENDPLQSTKIHINPNARSVEIPLNISQASSQTVHINPNFKNPNILSNGISYNTSHIPNAERKENVPSEVLNKAVVLTRTKLIRSPVVNKYKKLKRRNSVKSKYKIIKFVQSSPKRNISLENSSEDNKTKNRYKVDHRRRKSLSIVTKNQKKYVYINRFLSISDIAKTHVIKNSIASPGKNTTDVNINGVVYKKSRTSLRRASITNLSLKKSPNRIVQVSKYKLVKSPAVKNYPNRAVEISKNKFVKNPALKRLITDKFITKNKNRTENNLVLKKFKIVRNITPKKNKTTKVSPRKLTKCNIPCPYYKKYGLCKGKENGICFRKHDPDQIALCTRFLQGACIKENCLLSHNVSPEKMPTCKYYLEGSCSRENCSYLHVKISPKADVCRDFIQGFCKKAAECDKRHQYLCPDYEKYGNCSKQRCPYPHGKMVRKYCSNKTKFAKKSSDLDNKLTKKDKKFVFSNTSGRSVQTNVCENEQVAKEKQRYYDEKKSKTEEITIESATSGKSNLESAENNDEIGKSTTKNFIGLQSRPKLGSLPAFIPFNK